VKCSGHALLTFFLIVEKESKKVSSCFFLQKAAGKDFSGEPTSIPSGGGERQGEEIGMTIKGELLLIFCIIIIIFITILIKKFWKIRKIR